MPISCATARDLGDAMMAYAHRHLVATNHQHQPVLG